MTKAALLLLLALGACASEHQLANPAGPYQPLNAGLWTPPADLAAAVQRVSP